MSLQDASKTLATFSWDNPLGDRRSWTFSPLGRHMSEFVSPQSATTGVPTAAARWLMPESWPTKALLAANRAANSLSGKLRATRNRSTGTSDASRCRRSSSASPPTSNTFQSVSCATLRRNSSHKGSGQFFFSLPLPGCTANAPFALRSRCSGKGIVGVAFAPKIASRSNGFRNKSAA